VSVLKDNSRYKSITHYYHLESTRSLTRSLAER